jgi:hypothetical protein
MPNRPLRRFLYYAACGGTMAALAAGAGRVAAQPPGLHTLDFIAVTADGSPVTDLKASELTLRIGGKAREIRSLDLVKFGGAGSATPPASTPAAPPFATNAPGSDGGRTVLLIIDDESLVPGREQGLKASLSRIAAGVSPGDRLGLLSVRRTGGANIPPSTDHAKVKAAIEELSGHSTNETAESFTCRTMVTLQGLQSVFGAATGDAPAAILFFSASMQQPGQDMTTVGRGSSLCRLTPEMFEQTGIAAAGARAQFYVVHVIDGTSMPQRDAAAGIESLAGVLGTETLRLSGDGQALMDRILRETSAYYLAAFESDGSERAASQRIELRVAREGVRVKARHAIAFNRPAAKTSKAAPRDMLRVPTVYRDLPLRGAGFVARNPGDDKVRVVALFEPIEPGTKLTAASIGLYSGDKLSAQWSAQEADLARAPVMAALAVPKGPYRMRIAAVDANGRSGTVDAPLDAQMIALGPLQTSAMMLGTADKGFQPKLQFGASDTGAVAYMELYGVPKGATVTATLELAPSESAPALAQTPAQINPGATDDARLLVGGFSIGALPPGDVVMRAIVTVDGQPAGRAVRTMRKAGSGS